MKNQNKIDKICCILSILLKNYIYFSISSQTLSVYIFLSLEHGRNAISFNGFKTFCKLVTALSTFVTAILSALFAITIQVKLF